MRVECLRLANERLYIQIHKTYMDKDYTTRRQIVQAIPRTSSFFKIIFVLNVMSIYPRIFSRFFPFRLEQYCSQTLSMKKCVAFPV